MVPSFPIVVDASHARLEEHAGLLHELRAHRVNAIRVRGMLPAEETARAVVVLEAGHFATDDASSGRAPVPRFGRAMDRDRVITRRAATPEERVTLLGLPLQWSDVDLTQYFRTAELYRQASRTLWGSVDAEARVRACISTLARRPAEPARSTDGAIYGPSTIRRISDGGRIPPHFENSQLDFPACRDIAESIDAPVMSCFVQLATPEGGGQLVVHSMTFDDFNRSPTARDGEEPLAAALSTHESRAIDLDPGDALIFDSGYLAHEVTRVTGPKARWTMGGVFAAARDGERLLYWA